LALASASCTSRISLRCDAGGDPADAGTSFVAVGTDSVAVSVVVPAVVGAVVGATSPSVILRIDGVSAWTVAAAFAGSNASGVSSVAVGEGIGVIAPLVPDGRADGWKAGGGVGSNF
jgi:hypothetical protein